jgi:tight adherence protein B
MSSRRRVLTRPSSRGAGLIALLIALATAVAPAGAANHIAVAPAGGVRFPERALLVSGRGLPSLSARRVHIVENGQPVQALTLRSLKQPSADDFGVVLAIDISPNAAAIERAAAAALAIARTRPPAQQLGIVEADSTPPVTVGMTRDTAAIQRALATPPKITHHGLQIYDATLTGVQLLAGARISAGSVIILSDGADQGSPATLSRLLSAAAAAHVRIFSVGIRSPRFNSRALTRVARLSGGQFYEGRVSDLSNIFGDIESRLENEYLIRYYSVQGPGRRVPASIHIDGVPGTYDISYTSPSLTTARFGHAHRSASFWASTLAVLLIAGGCALLILIAALVLVAARHGGVRARVAAFISDARSRDPDITLDPDLPTNRLFDQTERVLDGVGWWEAFKEDVDIAGIKPSPIEVVFLTLAGAMLVGATLIAVTGSSIAGVLGALSVPMITRMIVRNRVRHQQKLFAEQLGEHLQEVAAAMRAGRSLIDSFRLVTASATEPLRREFERALADERLGMPFDKALEPIAVRMANRDMTQIALVAALDRRTGASAAEVIDRIAEGVRENAELRRELRALTAQVSLSRWILTALPIAVMLAISVTDPAYERPMYHTTFGIILLILCALMIVAGSLVMSRLIRIEP